MTTSEEMIRSIESARVFLYDLMNPKITPNVPLYIRKKAHRVTKHYPMSTEDLTIHLKQSATKVRQKCDNGVKEND
jgi:ribosome-associated translation inhibitor RaiA